MSRCSCGRSDVSRHVSRYSKDLGRLVCIHEREAGPVFEGGARDAATDGRTLVAEDLDFASHQFHPDDVRAAKEAGYLERTTKDGRPIFTSKRQVDRFLGFHRGTVPAAASLTFEKRRQVESRRPGMDRSAPGA